MSHQVTVRFSDGETRVFPTNGDQPILTAARGAGVNLVSQCEVGTCSTCVGVVACGDTHMDASRPLGISAQEIERGYRLLCQTRVLTDAVLDVEYPSALLDAHPSTRFRGKIVGLDWVAPSVVQLTLQLPKTLRFGFTAGQYCRLQVPGTDEWRSYSMANGEHEKSKLTFLIRILPDGVMSNYLRDAAKPGDVLEMEGPKGGFVLTPEYRPHILMAGGTGLAPMLSMLSRLRMVRPAVPPILLLFGCTNVDQLFHLEELAARASLLPSLDVRTMLVDNTGAPHVPVGNPVSALTADDIAPDSVAYLCGPPGMLRAAEEKLLTLGLGRHDIRMEQFLDSSK